VAAAAAAFMALLAERLSKAGSQVLILATLRSDFYGLLQLHPCGLHRLAGQPIPLGPMDVAGFRQAIEGPAKRVGLRLEPGLSDQLVADTATGDALPLLAFTLREMWDGRAAGAGLTLKQYQDYGGLDGAVQRRADAVLAQSVPVPSETEIADLQEAFVGHLIRLTIDGQAAKQPARRSALPSASLRLVDEFVAARLLVSGKGADGDQVEFAHEALLRTWPTLVAWIDAGREALLQRLRVRRLGEDLRPEAPERQRRQALEQLAALAAAGGSEERAVQKEARETLEHLLSDGSYPLADREDAALVLALIGAEESLRQCLGDGTGPVALRRRAAERLGLLARRCGDERQRQRIAKELEGWLCSDALNLLVVDSEGWAEHDDRLPLLQGASRGLQLAASADLPLAGSGPGRVVPMLTLTALEEEGGLRILTGVVLVPVWALPLPGGQQLELVAVPAGDYVIGSPPEEAGRNVYTQMRQKCVGVDVEALRAVRMGTYAMVRHPISQGQWRAVVEGVAPEQWGRLKPNAGTFKEPANLWERYGQPGALPVDSVSWNLCQEWLQALNGWIVAQWPAWAQQRPALRSQPPQLALPSESQWEVACRAGSAMPFHFGATLDPSWARYDASYSYGKGRHGENEQRPVPIGFFGLVNRWGLAELHGQIQEWCADQWHLSPVRERQAERRGWFGGGGQRRELLDGSAIEGPDPGLSDVPLERELRLQRGGPWFGGPHNCRAAYRHSNPPDDGYTVVGVRPGCFSPQNCFLALKPLSP
jgi:formylglycine-generating enzyme required for sulfatase activity